MTRIFGRMIVLFTDISKWLGWEKKINLLCKYQSLKFNVSGHHIRNDGAKTNGEYSITDDSWRSLLDTNSGHITSKTRTSNPDYGNFGSACWIKDSYPPFSHFLLESHFFFKLCQSRLNEVATKWHVTFQVSKRASFFLSAWFFFSHWLYSWEHSFYRMYVLNALSIEGFKRKRNVSFKIILLTTVSMTIQMSLLVWSDPYIKQVCTLVIYSATKNWILCLKMGCCYMSIRVCPMIFLTLANRQIQEYWGHWH